MLQRSHSPVDPGRTGWRSAVVTLLIGWCVVGMVDFGLAIREPDGVIVNRPDGTEGAVGIPLAGSELVTAVRGMLENAPDSRPWLLVLPGDMHPFVIKYIRYQLSHIAYPRRVDVTTPEDIDLLDDYVSIVAPPGFAPMAGWELVEWRNGLLRFERARS